MFLYRKRYGYLTSLDRPFEADFSRIPRASAALQLQVIPYPPHPRLYDPARVWMENQLGNIRQEGCFGKLHSQIIRAVERKDATPFRERRVLSRTVEIQPLTSEWSYCSTNITYQSLFHQLLTLPPGNHNSSTENGFESGLRNRRYTPSMIIPKWPMYKIQIQIIKL